MALVAPQPSAPAGAPPLEPHAPPTYPPVLSHARNLLDAKIVFAQPPAAFHEATPCDLLARECVVLAYALAAAASALIVWQLSVSLPENHVVAWGVAAICVIVAVPLTIYDVSKHVQRLSSPLQIHYVRILMMIPIFSIESWLALRYREQRHVLEALRSIYESFVIHSFFRLCVDFFQSDYGAKVRLAARGKPAATMLVPLSLWPFSSCLRPWRHDAASRGEFVERCKVLVAGK